MGTLSRPSRARGLKQGAFHGEDVTQAIIDLQMEGRISRVTTPYGTKYVVEDTTPHCSHCTCAPAALASALRHPHSAASDSVVVCAHCQTPMRVNPLEKDDQ